MVGTRRLPTALATAPVPPVSTSTTTLLPVRRTEHTDSPHLALVRDPVFSYAELRFRTPGRANPQSADGLSSRKRTGLPDCTLCFQFPWATEPSMEGSAPAEGPAPQAPANRIF